MKTEASHRRIRAALFSFTRALARFCRPRIASLLLGATIAAITTPAARGAEDNFQAVLLPFAETYCLECHDRTAAKGGIDLTQMLRRPDFARGFALWERVAAALIQEKMPPRDHPQPPREQRQQIRDAIQAALDAYIAKHAGEPGPVALRRLTSAEYDYAIEDLTGLDLALGREFVNDAVGGEGFSNVGDVQFLDDASLERYLAAAKTVADSAVIGAGPLTFFPDRGLTGMELSAVHRIQEIYRACGFRTAAGEGAEPYGLDRYPAAFETAWRFHHRAALGLPAETKMDRLAQTAGITPRFARHVWNVLTSPSAPFPIDVFQAAWRALPPPDKIPDDAVLRAACVNLYRQLLAWQSALAMPLGNDEEAPVLTEGTVNVLDRFRFRLSIPLSSPGAPPNITVRFQNADPAAPGNGLLRIKGLKEIVTPETALALPFGIHPRGGKVNAADLIIAGPDQVRMTLKVPPGATNLNANLEVELDLGANFEPGADEDQLYRCDIIIGSDELKAPARFALLAAPKGKALPRYWDGFLAFARELPQVSHREPAPSDRDPIPAPYDNKYESPDRNYFHYKVKYHRDDRFLVDNILDEETRERLDAAWIDLLGSFEIHDIQWRFLNKKFQLNLDAVRASDLTPERIASLPPQARGYAAAVRSSHELVHQPRATAASRRLAETLAFAERAWRRPLLDAERERLLAFYHRLRAHDALDHRAALRALLARILVAPAFLFRLEPAAQTPGVHPLSDHSLASRLSFFLWASLPDAELRRAADAGELRRPEALQEQTKRMLLDKRARRFASEFFGQWLGFYRFDAHEGVDTKRFPEFTDSLRASLHQEAVAFFDYIVRESRPVDEILFADYVFANQELARHYGLPSGTVPQQQLALTPLAEPRSRGGLLGLGAILAKTSPPLRTSPVKRGDWILRNILGTPPPPPPPDAGSLAADDVLDDGLSIRERLQAHSRKTSCLNCHARFDPLGFALEGFDPIGRHRLTYRDGQPIETSGALSDGTVVNGFAGLQSYLQTQRRLFHRTLSARLLGYALGRGELASDRPLIEAMIASCENRAGIPDLARLIVASTQFQHWQMTETAAASHGEPNNETKE